MIAANATSILENAHADICAHAERAGIDGERLLANLPEPGSFLTGSRVPVLSSRDQGRASVLFHLNHTRKGTTWPFLQFQSFRHGGIREQFNGLAWLMDHGNEGTSPPPHQKRVAIGDTGESQAQRDQVRRRRHQRLALSYSHGVPLDSRNHWLKQRFSGWMTNDVLQRTSGRHVAGNRLLFPINKQGQNNGFHQIQLSHAAGKRHFLQAGCRLPGSFVEIKAATDGTTCPTVLCEGVTTALAIARVWNGPVIAALTANNLHQVRNQINGPVIIAMDDDQWKPWAGNTGRTAAEIACQANDWLVAPLFRLNSLHRQPTDFNDLIILEGPDAVAACFAGLQRCALP